MEPSTEQKPETQKEERYFHFENVGKNIVTTVIGCVLMGMSAFALGMQWFTKAEIPATNVQLAVVATVGFALLFMRDKVSSYIDGFVKKKVDKE